MNKHDNIKDCNPFVTPYENPNPSVVGSVGAGKQYALKEVEERMKAQDIKNYVFDEEKQAEFAALLDRHPVLKGVHIDIRPGNSKEQE